MFRLVIAFNSVRTAEHLVAGVPAVARALRTVANAVGENELVDCLVVTRGPWTPGAYCLSECIRLAVRIPLRAAAAEGLALPSGTIFLRGEDLAGVTKGPAPLATTAFASVETALGTWDEEPRRIADMCRSSRAILLATGKPSDGIVSRHVNRPISRAISQRLLTIPGIVPDHATVGTALLGIVMAASLFTGTEAGLILGAVLFQAASIFDGVDGEIARATWRMTPRGAMLDSLIDAATNLAFVAGLAANLAMQGNLAAASTGAAGLVVLMTGLILIGQRSRAMGGNFTFDVVKHHVRKRPSRLMQWLTWLTMRDFFAAAGALLIVGGFAHHALIGFALCAAIWLIFVLIVLIRTHPRQGLEPVLERDGVPPQN